MLATNQIESGVHFGLDERAYHADAALGSSSLRLLLTAPENWRWNQPDNPLATPKEDSPSLIFGRAVHALVLEGRKAFEARFARKPEMPPGCLVTLDDMKEHCRKYGLKVTGTKAELAARIRTVDTLTPLETEITAEFVRENTNKQLLDEVTYARILAADMHIRKNVFHSDMFSGGYPEVSVFWKYKGVRVKARIDYLKPDRCIDLKSTAPWYGDSIENSWRRSVRTYRYDMQAAHYMQGRAVLAKYLAEGKVFFHDDDRPSDDWLASVAQCRKPTWTWIVYQSVDAPISQGFNARAGAVFMQRAVMDIERAIEVLKMNRAMFGDGLWTRQRDIIEMADEDFPPWWLDRPEI